MPTVVHVQRDEHGNVLRTEELEVAFLEPEQDALAPSGVRALHVSRDAHGREIARVELNVYISKGAAQ